MNTSNQADLILHNARITTLDPSHPEAASLTVNDGRVIGVDDDESITRFLIVFEEVNRDVPFKGLNWFFDHCETISDRNLERVRALGGGIAIQHRMAYQGEYFMDRYSRKAAERTPPVRTMLELDIPVGAGTDATRVASYNPWVSLYWLTTGKTVGGVSMYPDKNRLTREEALRLYTQGSSWFSSESGKKGAIAVGQLADFVALTDDYFSVPELCLLPGGSRREGYRVPQWQLEQVPRSGARTP